MSTEPPPAPECCNNCHFARIAHRMSNGVPEGAVQVCKRFPPTAHMALLSETNLERVFGPISTFPEIGPTEWCGEWKLKEVRS